MHCIDIIINWLIALLLSREINSSKAIWNDQIHLLEGHCFSPTNDNNSKQEKGTSDVETDYKIKSIPKKKQRRKKIVNCSSCNEDIDAWDLTIQMMYYTSKT